MDNPAAVLEQTQRLLSVVETLPRFPESGRPGRRSGTRELAVSRTPFIIAHRLGGELIEVLRVLHGRQRWPEGF